MPILSKESVCFGITNLLFDEVMGYGVLQSYSLFFFFLIGAFFLLCYLICYRCWVLLCIHFFVLYKSFDLALLNCCVE